MIEFLLANRWAAIGILLAAFGVYVGVLHWQLHSARADLSVCQANYQTALVANQAMKQAVAQQNAAVEAVNRQAVDKAKAADVEVTAAAQKASPLQRSASQLLGVKLGGDECADLRSIVDVARAGK